MKSNRYKISEFPTTPYKFQKKTADKVKDIILSGKLHHKDGRYIKEFETEFAKYIGAKYAFSTNSGTSALQLALHAIGICPGDEVIIPAYTFISVAQSVLAVGAIPIFADIDDTFNISPKDIEKKLSNKTKAIIVVHMFGNVARIKEILKITKNKKIKIIEDAAQSIGAEYNSKRLGSIGDLGYFSFNIQKAIPTGQGGMVVTSDPEYAKRISEARNRGIAENKDVVSIGYTMFMTEMEAILGIEALKNTDKLIQIRKENSELLFQLLVDEDILKRPYIPKLSKPNYYRLIFQLDESKLKINRDEFIKEINSEGIPFRTFYPTPLYTYSLFKNQVGFGRTKFPFSLNPYLDYKNVKCPNAEKFCKQQVGLDFSPYLKKRDIKKLSKKINSILNKNKLNSRYNE